MPNLKRVSKSQNLSSMSQQQDISTRDLYKEASEISESFLMVEPEDLEEPSREEQIHRIEQFLRALSAHSALPSSFKNAESPSSDMFLTPSAPDDTPESESESEPVDGGGLEAALDSASASISAGRGSEEDSAAARREIILRGLLDGLSVLERSLGPETESDLGNSSSLSLSSSRGSSGGVSEVLLRARLGRLKLERSELVNVWVRPEDVVHGGKGEHGKDIDVEDSEQDSSSWNEVTREVLIAAAANAVVLAAVWALVVQYGGS